MDNPNPFPLAFGIGVLIGLVIYIVVFFLTVRKGKQFLAPIITFLASILMFLFSIFVIGGFEGMPYGTMSVGILVIGIMGAVLGLYQRRLK